MTWTIFIILYMFLIANNIWLFSVVFDIMLPYFEKNTAIKIKYMIVVANWKMNFCKQEAKQLIGKLSSSEMAHHENVVICPPFTLLDTVNGLLKEHNTAFKLGAQNCFYEQAGAYTGEISGGMCCDLGCEYIILGHSERRAILGEDSRTIGKKILSAQKSGLCAILCIGENIEEYKQGKTLDVLYAQISESLTPELVDSKKLMIAYEPVWAIGSGKVPQSHEIAKVHSSIKEFINKRYGHDIDILYGGSVNGSNIMELVKIDCVLGFLVGGASMEYTSFLKILQVCNSKNNS